MSWLTKVTDLAGRAEEMLVKLDQNTSSAIQQLPVKARGSPASLSTPAAEPAAGPITDEVGGRQPSHSYSDYVRPVTQRAKQPSAGYAPSTSVLPEQRDAHLLSLLNDDGSAAADAAAASSSQIQQLGRDDRRTPPTRSAAYATALGGGAIATSATTQAASSRAPSSSGDHEFADSATVNSLLSQLSTKDSQLSILKAQLTEMEQRVARERKAAEARLAASVAEATNAAGGSAAATEAAAAIAKERDALQREAAAHRKKIGTLEEQVAQITDQLRLAKFNLTENKKEFDEYKEKAQKVLHTKERLIESLKLEGGSETKSNNVVQAELEEMRVERDLARGDLESAQVQLYNVRAELEEADAAARAARAEGSEARRRHTEEIEQWQGRVTALNERIECVRLEADFARAELAKQRESFAARLENAEAEVARETETSRRVARRLEEDIGDEEQQRLAHLLLAKEEELRTAIKEKQVLSVRLERALRTPETAVNMEGSSSSSSAAILSSNLSSAHPSAPLHSLLIKALSLLRGNPTARIYFFAYLIAIHLLLFFIILTYTPEIHGSEFPSKQEKSG